MPKSPAERKAAQRARQAAAGVQKIELALDSQELDMLAQNCAARRPGREPYELNDYIALLIRKDSAELEQQRDALAANEGYKQAFYEMADILGVGARPDSPKNVFELVIKPKLEALMKERGKLASENISLANLVTSWPQERCPVTEAVTDVQPDDLFPEANAYLNSVRAEGIHFAANRILAAWDAGFIDDTPAQVHDLTGAVLSALEFLPNASRGEFKRDFADEIRSGIAAQLRAGKDGE